MVGDSPKPPKVADVEVGLPLGEAVRAASQDVSGERHPWQTSWSEVYGNRGSQNRFSKASSRGSVRSCRTGPRGASFANYIDHIMEELLQGACLSKIMTSHLMHIDTRLIAVAVDERSGNSFAPDVLERASFAEHERELQEGAAEEHHELLIWPADGTTTDKVLFIATFPVDFVASMTMRHEEKWAAVTIPVGCIWLAALAYVLDVTANNIACALGIPEQLIGETVVAAGTSMPNVLAAILAGRIGKVDSAAAQAFGSNTFDILVAFALPYFLKVVIDGEAATISTDNAIRDGIINLGVLVVYVCVLIFQRWRLTKAVGYLFIAIYLIWVVYTFAAFLVPF